MTEPTEKQLTEIANIMNSYNVPAFSDGTYRVRMLDGDTNKVIEVYVKPVESTPNVPSNQPIN
jgi:hypothetical protein